MGDGFGGGFFAVFFGFGKFRVLRYSPRVLSWGDSLTCPTRYRVFSLLGDAGVMGPVGEPHPGRPPMVYCCSPFGPAHSTFLHEGTVPPRGRRYLGAPYISCYPRATVPPRRARRPKVYCVLFASVFQGAVFEIFPVRNLFQLHGPFPPSSPSHLLPPRATVLSFIHSSRSRH